MLALRTAQNESQDSNATSPSDNCTPNIIPCKIHHDGPLETPKRYWNPIQDDDGHNQTVYFRGRKLRGRRVNIPNGYQGVMAVPTERKLPSDTKSESDENGESVGILETQGTFNDFIVWGHETLPAADDTFVKGVEEWLKFAEVMHSSSSQAVESGK